MRLLQVQCLLCAIVLLMNSGFAQVPAAQQSPATENQISVPRLVNFSGKAIDAQGKTISGIAGVTFAIYKEESGGVPLWLETQNIQADAKGNYTVQLGTTEAEGLPLDLFVSGDARWLGVSVNGSEEQPRVLLLSVPYALKAADAQTLGGLPSSAFARASAAVTANPSAAAPVPNAPTQGTVISVGLSAPASDFFVTGSPVTKAGTLGLNWIIQPTAFDVAGAMVKRDNNGGFTAGLISASQLNAIGTVNASGVNATGTVNANDLAISDSSDFFPVTVDSSVAGAIATDSLAGAFTGQSWGVRGTTNSNDPKAYGVIGFATAATGDPIGVYGLSPASSTGIGAFGQNGPASTTSQTYAGTRGAGLWGDTGTSSNNGKNDAAAIIGTADDNRGGFFQNNSAQDTLQTINAGSGPAADFSSQGNTATLLASNFAGGPVLETLGSSNGQFTGTCSIDASGDLTCTGTKNAAVPLDAGKRYVAMSAIESPMNWFEDAGSGQLVNGSAVVMLDPDFIQTVNTGMDYKVFPVPNGDCKGLYVTHKTAASFEVRELGGGTSHVSFDYRIMALRKNYENVRFADRTKEFAMTAEKLARMEQLRSRLRAPNQPGHSHMPTKPMLNLHVPTQTPPAQAAPGLHPAGQTLMNQKLIAPNAAK